MKLTYNFFPHIKLENEKLERRNFLEQSEFEIILNLKMNITLRKIYQNDNNDNQEELHA